VRRTVLLVLIGLAFQASAETLPTPGLLDSRIRAAPYSADQVYRLRGFVGYQTCMDSYCKKFSCVSRYSSAPSSCSR
jgi:hypothetical protein